MDAVSKQAYEQQLTRSWWLLVIRGFMLTILGFYALLNPTTDTTLITVLVGVYLLVDGAMLTLLGFFGRKTAHNTHSTIIRGFLGIAFGLLAIVAPATAQQLAIYVAAAGLILMGVIDLVRSVKERNSAETGGSNLAFSLLLIITGIIIALLPAFSSETVIRVIGLFAVPVGLYMLIYAGRLRHAIKALRAAS